MSKIGIVTGTRAEYGLLKTIIEKVNASDSMELQLVVTGMHLSPEFGLTYQEIEQDGYPITTKIEMLLSSDTSVGITKSMGLAMISFADYYEVHKPDIVIILGDRYEMLAAASAAMIANVPIAHIGGGELTEGAVDEAIRHSITKMSHLHFTTTEEYRNRVIQLGEHPSKVYNVGALGVENIKSLSLWDKEKLEKSLGFHLSKKVLMVTYHPVTLENMSAEEQFSNLLTVLDKYQEYQVIFTKGNADTGGRIINQMIDDYVEKNSERCIAFVSMGQIRYLSALQFCSMVVGNSSSGIIEAPSFHIPTINIGDRQKGRICAKTVISCGSAVSDMEEAFKKAKNQIFFKEISKAKNPYEGNETSKRIVDIIDNALDEGIEIKKSFYDIKL